MTVRRRDGARREQLAGMERAQDIRRLAAGEAMKQQPRPPDANAKRWDAVVVGGTEAHSARRCPMTSEALDQGATFLVKAAVCELSGHCLAPPLLRDRHAALSFPSGAPAIMATQGSR